MNVDPVARGDAAAASRPLFSVLMAACDHREFIEAALDSVAAQTCDDFELVVVDDGSRDGTADVALHWMERFRRQRANRCVLLSTQRVGQSAALEYGFASCRGTLVGLLDSDDRWLPGKLAAVARAAAAAPEAGMLVHPLLVIDADGKRTGDVRPRHARLSEGDLRRQIEQTGRHVAPATTGVVIRADVFAALLPMPTRAFRSGADSYLTFGASLRAPVCVLPEPLGEYRIHEGSHYLQRMLSSEGLARSVALQRTIGEHFRLGDVVGHNSFFARNLFALAKLRDGSREQLHAFHRLARATLHDPSFRPHQRLLLLGYWLACLIAPRAVFARLWVAFQLRQTGYGRIVQRRATAGGAPQDRVADERPAAPAVESARWR